MSRYTTLLLAILGVSWCGVVVAQYYEPLYSDNGIPWRGQPGDMDICPRSGDNFTYTYAMEFKFDDLNDLDNVGGNGVKLYCRSASGNTVGYVSSLEGKRGDYQGIHSCPLGEYFNGFRLRVFPNQGTWGDDFAVDNLQLSCDGGSIVDGMDGVLPAEEEEKSFLREWVETLEHKIEVIRYRIDKTKLHGEWGSWAYCSPDMYVVGIQTWVEEGHVDDDAGLTDVRLYCV